MKTLAVAAVAALLVACGPMDSEDVEGSDRSRARGKAPSQLILGTWKDNPQTFSGNGRSLALTLRVTITSNTTTFSATCEFDNGTVLEADATASSTLTDTTLSTHSSNNQETRFNDMNCKANIGVFTASYTVDSSTLVLTFDDGERLVLSRD